MRSDKAKVLHELLGHPMLWYPLNALRGLKPDHISVVVGHQGDRVQSIFSGWSELIFSTQKEQKGTADALKTGLKPIAGSFDRVLVLNGDMPLIRKETLASLLSSHRSGRYSLTVGTFTTAQPGGYGRVVRNPEGGLAAIVEDRDATGEQRLINEVNGGVYVIERSVLGLLDKIRPANKAGEYYLTDMVGLAVKAGLRVGGCMVDEEDLTGVNSRSELTEASEILRGRIADTLMASGVTVMHPGTAFVDPEARVGRDTIIYPNVIIEGPCRVGRGCVIHSGVRLVDSRVGDSVALRDSSLIEESRIGSGCSIGPFAHIRPGSVLKNNVKVGNFVELKKAELGSGTKASHLSYIGDAVIGRDVNVGAGTITCNYDGKNKHRTSVGDSVFIGSDTQLVAPVRVGKGAYIGAGSTVTSDVPAGSLAISRVRQRNIKGWAAGMKKKGKDERREE